MRTLNRPMFNMGGPIKQGIMHGIREPHFRGKIVGSAMPHIQRGWQAFKNIFGKTAPGSRTIPRQGPPYNIPGGSQYSKGYPGPKVPGQNVGPGSVEVTEQIFTPKPWAAATGKYLKGSPEYAIGKKIVEGRGLLGKPIKWAAKSPLISGGLIYSGGKWLWPDGTEATDAEVKNIQKPGGYPKGKGKGTGTPTGNAAAFAQAQREERLNKYLQMMGYDTAKKTAIADALIDASKIVSDRGTLDRKNITGELINPIIQAASKRLDKPGQIREAVGLMMTKAGLEKEMYDAKPGTIAKNVQDMVKSGKYTEEEAWAIATKGSQGAVADIQGAIATGKVGAGDWPAFVRATGAQHGENVEVITDEQIKEKYKDLDKIPSAMEIIATEGITDDGIYVIGSETIRIKDGKPTQLR